MVQWNFYDPTKGKQFLAENAENAEKTKKTIIGCSLSSLRSLRETILPGR
jgi:hypothetical protein